MEYNYEKNTTNCIVTYHRERTCPNFFRVLYKDSTVIRYTPKEVGRVFGIAKFTSSVSDIREWCYEMVNKFGSEADKDNEEYKKYIERHGFGPEVHLDKGETGEEPNDNTKMVI